MSEKKMNKEIVDKQEGFENLVGFFDLLLRIDIRVNPENYKHNYNENDRYSNIKNE